MYPNHIIDKAEILLDRTYENIAVSVESLSGSSLKTNVYSGQNKLKLDLSSLPKGLYLIKIKTDNNLISTSKIVK
ncbi:MAG: T9SS type A sorting domain-containing protein [Paludibacter sp.]|nr:T9SS type A sorting domain-containing protein [Paludibacter sp.]